MLVNETLALKKNKSKRNKKKIAFDEEVVTKFAAQNLIKEYETDTNAQSNYSLYQGKSVTNTVVNPEHVRGKKRKQKKTKRKAAESDGKHSDASHFEEDNTIVQVHPKKKKKQNMGLEAEIEGIRKYEDVQEKTSEAKIGDTQESKEVDSNVPEVEKEESIRARKRKKYQKLVEEQKLKNELNMQQKCLNYLSQWKHSRSSWRFEKLKQIWLQQNVFDNVRIPDKFWDTLVEYFSSSKGKVKETILKEALKVVEDTESIDVENSDVDIKYKRARHIVQNLEE